MRRAEYVMAGVLALFSLYLMYKSGGAADRLGAAQGARRRRLSLLAVARDAVLLRLDRLAQLARRDAGIALRRALHGPGDRSSLFAVTAGRWSS